MDVKISTTLYGGISKNRPVIIGQSINGESIVRVVPEYLLTLHAVTQKLELLE